MHEDKPYKHDVNLVSETDCFEDVNDAFKVLGRVLDACPTMVPLESHYPYLPACSQVAVVNYAQKVSDCLCLLAILQLSGDFERPPRPQ